MNLGRCVLPVLRNRSNFLHANQEKPKVGPLHRSAPSRMLMTKRAGAVPCAELLGACECALSFQKEAHCQNTPLRLTAVGDLDAAAHCNATYIREIHFAGRRSAGAQRKYQKALALATIDCWRGLCRQPL